MNRKDINEDAIFFHTINASRFDNHYHSKKSFTERYTLWTKLIDKYNFNNKRIIDIGCGSGVLSFYLATKNNTVIGIDGSPKMIELCCEKLDPKNTNLSFVQKTIPFNSKKFISFDGIICSSVLEYIKDVDATLDLFNELLIESGTLIVSVPNNLSLYRILEKLLFKIIKRPRYYKYVYNLYSFNKFKSLLKEKGFQVKEVSYYSRSTSILDFFSFIKSSKYFKNLFVCVCTKVNS
jgi:2-polyprenyl-6-hydroxyphenyl methylase/3-demethylubiquinone-9 3-methyltransferase